jgi:hypothetical protein
VLALEEVKVRAKASKLIASLLQFSLQTCGFLCGIGRAGGFINGRRSQRRGDIREGCGRVLLEALADDPDPAGVPGDVVIFSENAQRGLLLPLPARFARGFGDRRSRLLCAEDGHREEESGERQHQRQ